MLKETVEAKNRRKNHTRMEVPSMREVGLWEEMREGKRKRKEGDCADANSDVASFLAFELVRESLGKSRRIPSSSALSLLQGLLSSIPPPTYTL